MLDNCKYNKIKLLHELSSILWFLKKCCIQDAKNFGDLQHSNYLKEFQNDLEKHIKKIDESL
jgi:hypothetical protein